MRNSSIKARLTRRASFSCGHRYWQADLSPSENRAKFGPTANSYNHGHNYVLDVTVEGEIDPTDGMVLNIKDIDALLKKRVLSLFDGKSINDELPPFSDVPPSTENVALCIWDLVAGQPIRLRSKYLKHWRWDADLLADADESLTLPETCCLVKLRLEELPGFYVELESGGGDNIMTLTRTYEFAASHRLHLDSLSSAENQELFGKCNNEAGHGHNYVLEVTVEGEPDGKTGMLADIEKLDARVHSRVVDRFDHKNLNLDIPELKGINPTSENVAAKIFQLLDGHLPARLYRIRLHETMRNSFEIVR